MPGTAGGEEGGVRAPLGASHDSRLVGGVLGLLLLLGFVARATNPEARLRTLVRSLPSTAAVLLVEDDPASARSARVRAFLGLPVAEGVRGNSPVAWLALYRAESSGLDAVALLDPADARRVGASGSAFRGFTAVGPPEALARLTVPAPATLVPPAALRLLRQTDGTRVLARRDFLNYRLRSLGRAAALPASLADALGVDDVPEGAERNHPSEKLTAFAVTGDLPRVRVRAVFPGDAAEALHGASRLLRGVPEGALAVLDGLPLRYILPSDPPPLLGALLDRTGVGAALRELVQEGRDFPSALLVTRAPDGSARVALALRWSNPAAGRAFTERIRNLLGEITRAPAGKVEVREVAGRRIVHLRPPTTSPASTRETSYADWQVHFVHSLGGGSPAVIALHDHAATLLSSVDDLPLLAGMIRSAAEETILFLLDGEGLRRLPVVTHVLRGFAASLQSHLETVGTVRLELRRAPEAVLLDAVVDVRPR